MLEKDQRVDISDVTKTLREFGFREVDYVYEPGQFALRGSILDVYSFSCEYPYRVDLFGDDIDSIRTFEVEDQLSKEQKDRVEIVPELTSISEDKVAFLSFVPADTILVTKDYLYVRDAIERTYQEGFSAQARMEQMENATEMEQREIERQLRRESLRRSLMPLCSSISLRNRSSTRISIFSNRPSRTICYGDMPSTYVPTARNRTNDCRRF